MSHPYVTIRSTALRLQVHENTVRNWVDKGILQALRLPTGARRIPVAEVERLERQMFAVPTSFYEQQVQPAPKSVHDTAQDRVEGRYSL